MVGALTGDAIPKALPCKSFEPIGRHARIIRATLQDCRLGRLGGHPRETSRYRGPGLSLHLARGSLLHYRPPTAE